ncbi:MAG: XrtA/PEP-CTERM system histidine kinase PrsK [Pseudomonadota bacterium]
MGEVLFDFIGQWSHALAAILFGALAVWQVQRNVRDGQSLALLGAAIITALWALLTAMASHFAVATQLIEQLRNAAWLGFMYMLWRNGEKAHRTGTVAALYVVLLGVIGVATGLILIGEIAALSPRVLDAMFLASAMIRMIIAVGALLLVHNLYNAATLETRAAIRLPMFALTLMWVYDLNLYTVCYLSRNSADELFALRGLTAAIAAPIFALATRHTSNWNVRLSRSITFQSLSLVAIGGYIVTMLLASSALELIGGAYVRLAQVSFVFGASVIALVLLPSSRLRAWFRVKISKHLFQHRYDYRAEWLRFTDTLGRPGEGSIPLETRVIQAVADITESAGGVLLLPDDSGGLVTRARWNWDLIDPPTLSATSETARWLQISGRVVELDLLRNGGNSGDEDASHIPEWLIAEPGAWAMIPLIHFERLAGVVILERPPIARMLDWEDFDLLRVVGRKVASYLEEARGQEALSDAQRFDEFNRRFAFIMHDIKNLVSQLSLVTRNVERHADNPEFRADMIVTLQNSTARMNDLLARLSQHNKSRPEEPRTVALQPIAESIAKAKRAAHPVVVGGTYGLVLHADPARLEQALSHLVQNAIDASPSTEPVSINPHIAGDEIAIDVIDNGKGMSPAFIREQLFKPFTSTKDGGFGIGAFEARALIAAMDGRIEVASREGKGSRFTIFLPGAAEIRLDPIGQQEAA